MSNETAGLTMAGRATSSPSNEFSSAGYQVRGWGTPISSAAAWRNLLSCACPTAQPRAGPGAGPTPNSWKSRPGSAPPGPRPAPSPVLVELGGRARAPLPGNVGAGEEAADRAKGPPRQPPDEMEPRHRRL